MKKTVGNNFPISNSSLNISQLTHSYVFFTQTAGEIDMNHALKITFKNTERTEHVTEFIENRFQRLKRINGNIIRCNVVISAPHKSQKNGNEYHVTIDVIAPGKEYVGKGRSKPNQGSDLYVAISEAFQTLQTKMKYRRGRHGRPQENLPFGWFDFQQYSAAIKRIQEFTA